MSKLADGQTITSYAIFRIVLKERLHAIDTNVFEKLPIIKEKKWHTHKILASFSYNCIRRTGWHN